MTEHQQVRLEFDAYALGRLAPEAAFLLGEHLAACEPCEAAWQQHQEISQALAALPLADPGSDFLARVMAGLPARRTVARAEVLVLASLFVLISVAAVAMIWLLAKPGVAAPWTVANREAWGWLLIGQREVFATVTRIVQALPLQQLTQGLWATALGLIVAYGVPVGQRLAYARRRLH